MSTVGLNLHERYYFTEGYFSLQSVTHVFGELRARGCLNVFSCSGLQF